MSVRKDEGVKKKQQWGSVALQNILRYERQFDCNTSRNVEMAKAVMFVLSVKRNSP